MNLVIMFTGAVLLAIGLGLLPMLTLIGGGNPKDVYSHRDIQLEGKGKLKTAALRATFWLADHRGIVGTVGLALLVAPVLFNA